MILKKLKTIIPILKQGTRVINLYEKGLKIEIKEDGSPVSNGFKSWWINHKKIKELVPISL